MATTIPRDPTAPRPHGLGIAIVFDWALTAQLLTQAAAVPAGRLGQTGGVGIVLVRVAGAVATAVAGEALRRGVRVVRPAQIVLTAALSVGGVLMAAHLLGGGGGRGLILSALIQITFAPFIALRLSTAETARWFAAANGHGRAPLLSGRPWVALLVVQSALWGVVVAWSQSL